MIDDRIISGYNISNEDDITLRPTSLKEYVGQYAVKDNVSIFIQAALKRQESLEYNGNKNECFINKSTIRNF